MTSLGECLYLWRLDKGLTQKDLAQRTGVPQPNISQIEKGQDLTVSTMRRLAAGLDIQPADLLQGIPPVLVDKKKFFHRNVVEKVAANVAGSPVKLPPQWEETARLLKQVSRVRPKSEYARNKDVQLAWMKLRMAFSSAEMAAIFSRIRKAEKRRGLA